MTITRDWLQKQIAEFESCAERTDGYRLDEGGKNTLEALRIALASLEAEPVAWAHRLINKLNGVVHPWVYGSAEASPSEGDIFNIEVMPLYDAPPAPGVPDELLSAMEDVLRISDRDHDAWSRAKLAIAACRAAMQGKAEPVTTDCKLPSREHFISLCNKFWNWQEADEINAGEEEPRLEWNGSEFTHRVTQALWRMYQASPGNSPVIQDGWVACSERMPNDKDYVWCWGRIVGWTEDDRFEAYHDATRNKWWAVTMDGEEPVRKVTHWMPMPAAPQQEVKP